MLENAYLTIKNSKVSRAADSLLCLHDSTPLCWQFLTSVAGPSLDQVLDPHLHISDSRRKYKGS